MSYYYPFEFVAPLSRGALSSHEDAFRQPENETDSYDSIYNPLEHPLLDIVFDLTGELPAHIPLPSSSVSELIAVDEPAVNPAPALDLDHTDCSPAVCDEEPQPMDLDEDDDDDVVCFEGPQQPSILPFAGLGEHTPTSPVLPPANAQAEEPQSPAAMLHLRFKFRRMVFLLLDLARYGNQPGAHPTQFMVENIVDPAVRYSCGALVTVTDPKTRKTETRPCGESFARSDIVAARAHFRAMHYAEDERKADLIVPCRWDGCNATSKFKHIGRHLEVHWEIEYRCPHYPLCHRGGAKGCLDGSSLSRTDALIRHLNKCPVEDARADMWGGRVTKKKPKDPVAEEPVAGPSSAAKLRSSRARTSKPRSDRPAAPKPRSGRPAASTQAQPGPGPSTTRLRAVRLTGNQPAAGSSRGRKRSRGEVEEEEKENIEEVDDEAVNDDAEDDSGDDDPKDDDYNPRASKRKGKQRQSARKGKEPMQKKRKY